MKAFAPNTHSILESLAQMSEKFASWSATVAQSDGFKSLWTISIQTVLNS